MLIDKEAQDRLYAAVDDITAGLEAGCDPHQAIAAAMRRRHLGPGFVPLLTAACNVSQALDQQDRGSRLLDKLAVFPLVDAGEVMERLYPDGAPSPAELHRKQAVAVDYMRPPDPLPSPSPPPSRSEKPASVRVKRAAESSPQAKSTHAPGWQYVRALDRFHESLGRIVDYFRKPPWWREKFSSVWDWAGWRWGEPARAILRYVPERIRLHKQAEAADVREPNFDQPPYCLLAEALQRARELAAVRPPSPPQAPPVPATRTSELLAKDGIAGSPPRRRRRKGVTADGEQVVQQVSPKQYEGPAAEDPGGSIWPFYKPAEDVSDLLKTAQRKPSSGKNVSKGGDKGVEGGGGWFGQLMTGAAGGLATQGLGAVKGLLPQAVDPRELALKLYTPELDRRVAAARVRSIINDLASTDPVISGYSLDEILEAYNELAQQAPLAMRHPATIRAFLRKRLTQGGLETFEASELRALEEKFNPYLQTVRSKS